MLWIVTHNNHSCTWYVGEPKPTIEAEVVASIQADGHELGAILEQFDNLPKHKSSPVQEWFGDHAKLIWANLR